MYLTLNKLLIIKHIPFVNVILRSVTKKIVAFEKLSFMFDM